MEMHLPSGRLAALRLTLFAFTLIAFAAIGCATPGVPRPPSLNLPEPPRDLAATRVGDTVELRFTVPTRTTDKLPLRGSNLTASFCRAPGAQPCQLASSSTIVVPLDLTGADGQHKSFTWTDVLPSDLTHGDPRPLHYSVEVLNLSGRSAGLSAPAFTAAGQAPTPVTGLGAEGSRLGVVLRWNGSERFTGDVVLEREDLVPDAKSKIIERKELTLPVAGGVARTRLLDTFAKPNIPYRYTATRRVVIELAHHSVEMRSAMSEPVDITLKSVYPPLAPTGLTAAAFTSSPGVFAVDLIWQPVDDAGLVTPLAGYNLYRVNADGSGHPTRLNATPITLPAFHDITVTPKTRYLYTVTALDVLGNESGGDGVVLEP